MASHPVPFTRPRPEQPPVPDASGPAPADSTDHPEPDEAPEDQTGAGRETADRDAAAHSAAASPAASESGTAGKDNPQEKAKDKEPAAPDDAEISRWAQNLRPEDF